MKSKPFGDGRNALPDISVCVSTNLEQLIPPAQKPKFNNYAKNLTAKPNKCQPLG
jgi:hypothetical protein